METKTNDVDIVISQIGDRIESLKKDGTIYEENKLVTFKLRAELEESVVHKKLMNYISELRCTTNKLNDIIEVSDGSEESDELIIKYNNHYTKTLAEYNNVLYKVKQMIGMVDTDE